jgi:hypothetical protein
MHFIRFKDQQGENVEVILDGAGLPYDGTESGTGTAAGGSPGTVLAAAYNEANLFQLGVPTVVGSPF